MAADQEPPVSEEFNEARLSRLEADRRAIPNTSAGPLVIKAFFTIDATAAFNKWMESALSGDPSRESESDTELFDTLRGLRATYQDQNYSWLIRRPRRSDEPEL